MAPAPDYGCKCLNVLIFAEKQLSSIPRNSKPEQAGFDWVYLTEKGLFIKHEPLIQRVRHGIYGLLLCRLCFTLVGRIEAESPHEHQQSNRKESPSRDSPEQRDWIHHRRWVQVCTTADGCLTGRALASAQQRASPIFDIIVPSRETESPLPTPPPIPSPQLPAAAFLNNLPEMFPPPPFVPSHPVYTSLSRIAKRHATTIRTRAEEEINAFIESQRKAVIAAEADLKTEVNSLWKSWKDGQDKQLPSIAHSTTVNRPHAPTVIREFKTSSPPPRPQIVMASSATVFSALSTSMRNSSMHMPRPLSPPTELSPLDAFDDTPTASPSQLRSRPTNRKTKTGIMEPPSISPSPPEKKAPVHPRSAIKRRATSAVKPTGMSMTADTSKSRKAVTFNTQDSVVTVARDIAAERMERIKEEQARGEEPMFDMDEEEGGSPEIPTTTPKNGVSMLSHRLAVSPVRSPNGSLLSQSVPIASALQLSERNESALKYKEDRKRLKHELMTLMGGQTPTHRSTWLQQDLPLYEDEEGGSGDEHDPSTDDEEGDASSILPSTSVPISIPTMPALKGADSSLQEAMSKSVDPGPVLDLDALRSSDILNQDGEDGEDDITARAIAELQPGRGSLHAQRILERNTADPPASMWRSLA